MNLKRSFTVLFSTFLIGSFSICHARTKASGNSSPGPVPKPKAGLAADAPLSLSLWFDGKIRAASFTFDDTKKTQLTVAYPLFKEYGYKCTFFINPGRIGPKTYHKWSDWKKLADDGFEIGSHTMSHGFRPIGGDPQRSVDDAYDIIEKECGVPPYMFAFPGGSETKVTRGYFNKSKHIGFRHQGIYDDDRKKLKPRYVYHGCGEGSIVAERARENVEGLLKASPNWHGGRPIWLYTITHDVTKVREAGLRAMLDELNKHKDKVWITTYGNANRYAKQRDTAKMKITTNKMGKIVFTLDHPLDKSIYNFPMTVWFEPKTRLKKASVKQRGKKLPSVLVDGKMRVAVVPGKDPVTIVWK